MKLWSLFLLAGFVLFGCMILGCKNKATINAVTGATIESNSILPPSGDSYTVIGNAKGINGYIIKYDDIMFRGGDPAAPEGVEELKKHDIATIVSITPVLCRHHIS